MGRRSGRRDRELGRRGCGPRLCRSRQRRFSNLPGGRANRDRASGCRGVHRYLSGNRARPAGVTLAGHSHARRLRVVRGDLSYLHASAADDDQGVGAAHEREHVGDTHSACASAGGPRRSRQPGSRLRSTRVCWASTQRRALYLQWTVQARAYRFAGAAPISSAIAPSSGRLDVAALPARSSCNWWFRIDGASLSPGTYNLVVFAHSTVTRTFNDVKVVRITVQ